MIKKTMKYCFGFLNYTKLQMYFLLCYIHKTHVQNISIYSYQIVVIFLHKKILLQKLI